VLVIYSLLITIRSIMPVRRGVMDMGRKLECVFGLTVLLTGQIVLTGEERRMWLGIS